MNKKVTKIVSILMLVVMMVSVATSVFAITPIDVKANENTKGAEGAMKIGSSIVGILQTVGVILSVVVLIVLGIKYMMGSAEEKAEYKKTMIPYVVGAALIFTASALAQVVYNFFTGVSL